MQNNAYRVRVTGILVVTAADRSQAERLACNRARLMDVEAEVLGLSEEQSITPQDSVLGHRTINT